MSTNKRLDQQIVVYSYNEMLFSDRKECAANTHNIG